MQDQLPVQHGARNRRWSICQKGFDRFPQRWVWPLISIEHQGPISALASTMIEKKSMLTNKAIPSSVNDVSAMFFGKLDRAIG